MSAHVLRCAAEIVLTQSPLDISLVRRGINRGAVQLAGHATLELSSLDRGLVVAVKADDILLKRARSRAHGLARRTRDRLERSGEPDEGQEAKAEVDNSGGRSRAVKPAGHGIEGGGRPATYETAVRKFYR